MVLEQLHPLNDRFFGITGIEVSFYNNTAVVNGYIIEQPGTNEFVVSDGVISQHVTLAQTLAVAADLAVNPHSFTIPITAPDGAIEHVARIWSTKVHTVEGNDYHWSLGAALDGSAVIARYS